MAIDKSAVEFINKDFVATSIPEVFALYQHEIINALKENLERVGRVASGVLSQSIRIDIEEEKDTVSFVLYMEDYWKYVDQGRRKGAKMPPQEAMLEFIKLRGIKPREPKGKSISRKSKKLSMDSRRKQLAFAIGRSISKKGIEPTHFFTDVVNDNLKKRLTKDISKALAKDISIEFGLTNKVLNG